MNLTELDDTLLHQSPLPFEYVASSDHRFFDRYWFEIVSPDGKAATIIGMGRYANMNVLDGFISAQVEGGRQYNVRFSRELRPAVAETRVGGLEISVIKPLQSFQLTVSPGDHALACDVRWNGNLPCFLEDGTSSRQNGRVVSDAQRFNQLGTVDGTISIDGHNYEVRDWWSVRDHSWGIRPGVGGFEPVTSQPDEQTGVLFLWFAFRVAEFGGYFQLFEDQDGSRLGLAGEIVWPESTAKPSIRIVDVRHDIVFHEGMRAYKSAHLTLVTEDGAFWEVEAEPIMTAWAYNGTGYGTGYDDGKGLGVYRGAYLEEHDIYDVSHPEIVRNPDGEQINSGHREQPCHVTVNGAKGIAHFPVLPRGHHKRYGL